MSSATTENNVSFEKSVGAGLDLEMPKDVCFGASLEDAIDNGTLEQGVLDDKCTRILRQMFRFGLFEKPLISPEEAVANMNSNTSNEVRNRLARKIAAEGRMHPNRG